MFRGRIVSDVMLCAPENADPAMVRVRALWDTGCSNTLVSARVADFLRLSRSRSGRFRSPFGGVRDCEMAAVKIGVVLGGECVTIEAGIAAEPNSDMDCDVTLGLDFISLGDFAITHDDGQLCMSFCYPPVGYPTDYTLIKPRMTSEGIIAEDVVIDESESVERDRRAMEMVDCFRR